jgi:hypothetical protein
MYVSHALHQHTSPSAVTPVTTRRRVRASVLDVH